MSNPPRLPAELPVLGQKYVEFDELFTSVRQQSKLRRSKAQSQQAFDVITDIVRSLKVKKSAAEHAGRSFDLDEEDLEEYCAVLEDFLMADVDNSSCITGSTFEGESSAGDPMVDQWVESCDLGRPQTQELNKIVDTLFNISAIITKSENFVASDDTKNKTILQLDNLMNSMAESLNHLHTLHKYVSDDMLMCAFEERLESEKHKRNLQFNKMLKKLVNFQRIRQLTSTVNGGNGDSDLKNKFGYSCEEPILLLTPPLFDIQPGPLVENLPNFSSYLSYGIDGDTIYVLLEKYDESANRPTQLVWSLSLKDRNTIESLGCKKWADLKALSRISVTHGGLFFGTCQEHTGNSNLIRQLDKSEANLIKVGDNWFAGGPAEFQDAKTSIHFGTPERLITIECVGDNKIQLNIFVEGEKCGQQCFKVPIDIHTVLAFFRKDYFFLANEQSADLVVVKVFENRKILNNFQICKLKMSDMEGVHGIVAIDREDKIYLVAIQLSNLYQLMIYELQFSVSEDPSNFAPTINLVQTAMLPYKLMALIRTERTDKIVFITIEEKVGVLHLKAIHNE